VSVQEGDAEVAAFVARHGLSYPFLMDRTGAVSASYRVTTTPTTYFISPEGEIVDSVAGVVPSGWLDGLINDYI